MPCGNSRPGDLSSKRSGWSAASHVPQRCWGGIFYAPLPCDDAQDELKLAWFGHELPAWSYHRAAADIISNIFKSWDATDSVKASSAATRLSAYAWRFAMHGLVMIWSAWLVYPAVVAKSGMCQNDGSGLPTCSHYALLSYLPVIVLVMWMEHQVLAVMIPLEVAYIGGKTLLGCKVSFVIYRLLISGISALSQMDVATNSLFIGRVVLARASSDCKLDSVWRMVAKRSVFRSLPDLTVLTIIAYGMMGFQFLFALYCGLPWFTNKNRRVKGLRWWLTLRAPQMGSPYAITLHSRPEEVWGTQLLRAIVPAARMSATRSRDAEFFHVSDGAQVRQHGGDQWTRAAMSDLARVAATNSFLRLCIEGAAFSNVQATLLGIDKAIDGSLDLPTMFSILLSCCTAAYTLSKDMTLVYTTLRTLWPELNDRQMTDLDRKYQAEGYSNVSRSSLRGPVIRTFIVSCVTIVVFFWLTAYAGLKCAMAYYCADGPWNFSWPLRDGCVILSDSASG